MTESREGFCVIEVWMGVPMEASADFRGDPAGSGVDHPRRWSCERTTR
jgi:hypothetical protein